MIGIINLGLSNVGSVQRMIKRNGGNSILISNHVDLKSVNKIIIPGVGHFDEGMNALHKCGLKEAIIEFANKRSSHILGICLGMQLLCRGSTEGLSVGLGLVDGEVKKFNFVDVTYRNDPKIPHMGWNRVNVIKENFLIPNQAELYRFYFVHSYYVIPDFNEIIIATTNHGVDFCSAFKQGNIYGVQFHPEKSHRYGMELIRRFLEL